MLTRPHFHIVQRLALASLLVVLAGCASRQAPYTEAYRTALNEFNDTAAPTEQSIERFLAVYSGMTGDGLADRVDDAYAESLYFNDTLKVIHSRDELQAYLEKTAHHLEAIKVEVLSVSSDRNDVYVRWIMHTQFSVAGRDIDAESIGITHLRFDSAGKVILHQDFWDNTEGLFSHLPFVGGIVRWARSKT